MSWRVVVIASCCKLDYKMGYMALRSKDGVKKIYIDEIATVIVENTSVSITACLLSELVKRKVKIIFCDEKRNPSSEVVTLYGSHDCSAKIKKQMMWSKDIKASVWTEIVREKIEKQADFLRELNKLSEADILEGYISEIEFNDTTNREGNSAKVYFNALFGKDFTRSKDNAINAALNYGYSIILSAINREVTARGYLTQLGLFHDNMFNQFNLSCDLMEPFRIIADRRVKERGYCEFNSDEKHDMIGILNSEVIINSERQYLMNAIKIYCKSVFDALCENDISLIKFFEL